MMAALLAAAKGYAERGWTPIALGLDRSGRPKRALTKGFPQLTTATWEQQPWARAIGLGILLGPPSGNLAAIDVDDHELADSVFALMLRRHSPCRMVRTGRGRLHAYFVEVTPSRTHIITVRFRGRDLPVELRAKDVQVTAPPSPGYSLTGYDDLLDVDPPEVPSIGAAWGSIAQHLGVEVLDVPSGGTAGYPEAWKPRVVEGDRNKSMYIEAHRLRGAGMPLEAALELLRLRYESAYEGGDSSWAEMAQTIRSAYRGGPVPGAADVLQWSVTE